jgi:hypothetical protein
MQKLPHVQQRDKSALGVVYKSPLFFLEGKLRDAHAFEILEIFLFRANK